MQNEKYVIITGGELANKGAQSMTFIVVDEISKRFPDCTPVLFPARTITEKDHIEDYKFKIVKYPTRKERLKLYLRANDTPVNGVRVADILRNAVLWIDISGYILGSTFGIYAVQTFLTRLILAKHWDIPMYIMPQSFGPLSFTNKRWPALNLLLKKYLKHPRIIYAREVQSQLFMEEKYKLKNIKKSYDMVLINKGVDLENIYCNEVTMDIPHVSERSVAIIPNSKNKTKINEEKFLRIYRDIVSWLLANGKTVYLLYHATEDYEICQKIKDFYLDNDNVIKVENELSCFEYDEVISSFDYIVASRYHSIVHAYRKGTPAVVLGWANKYAELMDAFEQRRYQFEVSDALDSAALIEALSEMEQKYKQNSEKILQRLDEIQSENLYEELELKNG